MNQRSIGTPGLKVWLVSLLLLALVACSQTSTDALPGEGALETQAVNLVTNSGFSGTDGWTSYFNSPATGNFTSVDGAAKLNIQNTDGTYWKVQLYQDMSIRKAQLLAHLNGESDSLSSAPGWTAGLRYLQRYLEQNA